MKTRSTKNIALIAMLGATMASIIPMRAAAPAPHVSAEARPFIYAAGGIAGLLVAPFIYDGLYYSMASEATINRDARALLSRVRSRYPQLEQIARGNNHGAIESLVSRFFSQRYYYDSLLRRWGLRAPEHDACRYFNWRTQSFLHQLNKYQDAVTDARLKRELGSLHRALQLVDGRVNSLES